MASGWASKASRSPAFGKGRPQLQVLKLLLFGGNRPANQKIPHSALSYTGKNSLYLLFANLDSDFPVVIGSYYEDRYMGARKLGSVKAGRKDLWTTLNRKLEGQSKEEIIFNGAYVGDLRYNISKGGE